MTPPPPRRSPLDYLYEFSLKDSFETFQSEMTKAMLFPKKAHLRRYVVEEAIANAPRDGLWVEFGVAAGDGIRLIARIIESADREITGFDSFEGLKEDWTGHHLGRIEGAFSQDGVLPKVPANAHLVKGWVEDTLPGYLKDTGKTPFAFLHFDMDTYSPTKFALAAVKKRLKKGTVLLFDELYGYPGWREHEYRALSEVLKPDSYRFLAFSREAVAIQMTKSP